MYTSITVILHLTHVLLLHLKMLNCSLGSDIDIVARRIQTMEEWVQLFFVMILDLRQSSPTRQLEPLNIETLLVKENLFKFLSNT